MTLTSVFFNFIFYSNTSNLVSLLQRDECINYCSTFYISAIPGVHDAQFIKKSKIAKSFLNDTRFMKPTQFHTDIYFDFNKKLWLEYNFFGSKPIAEDRWVIDKQYSNKFPVLRDSLGILFYLFIQKRFKYSPYYIDNYIFRCP